MPDLAGWALRSPLRLLVVLAVVVAVLAGAGTVVGRTPSPERAAGAPGTAARLPPTQAPVQAALRFTRAWARVPAGDSDRWLAGVRALATDDLAAGLALTDPDAVPGTSPTSRPSVRFAAEDSALVVVPLADGQRVVVTMVRDGTGWLASDIQPDVGDHGAAP